MTTDAPIDPKYEGLDLWFLKEAREAARGAFALAMSDVGPLFLNFQEGALCFAETQLDGFAICNRDDAGKLCEPEALPTDLTVAGVIAWTTDRARWIPCLKRCTKCRVPVTESQFIGPELCDNREGL